MRKLAYFAAIALLCTGIAVAQSTSSPDQSSSPSAQQPSSSSPSSTPSDQASPSSDQNQAAPSTSDQSGQAGAAAATSDQAGSEKAGKKLPQTASPLPFLSLLGMGMMGAGGLGRVRNYFRK